MVNLNCKPDEIQSHLGDRSLGMQWDQLSQTPATVISPKWWTIILSSELNESFLSYVSVVRLSDHSNTKVTKIRLVSNQCMFFWQNKNVYICKKSGDYSYMSLLIHWSICLFFFCASTMLFVQVQLEIRYGGTSSIILFALDCIGSQEIQLTAINLHEAGCVGKTINNLLSKATSVVLHTCFVVYVSLCAYAYLCVGALITCIHMQDRGCCWNVFTTSLTFLRQGLFF